MTRSHSRAIIACLVWLVAGGFSPADDDAQPVDASATPEITIAINTFRHVFRQGEPARVGVAIVNRGKETVYIPSMAAIGVSLYGAEGHKVRLGPIPTPPPPPPEHYMEYEGQKILMEPVWALSPGGGKCYVAADVLKYYHVNVTPGTYTFQSAATRLVSRPASAVVTRDGLAERLWGAAGPVTERVTVCPSNTVEIRIEEPNQ